jgi:hypothetical protein
MFMNSIAINQRLTSSRSTAAPLHERKARAKPNGGSFDAVLARKAQKTQKTQKTDTLPATVTNTATASSELNTSLKWYDHAELENLCPVDDNAQYNSYMDNFRMEKYERTKGMAKIALGPNELPKFMAELQNVKESGGCLTEFLKQFIPPPVDRLALNPHDLKLATRGVDLIWLNPETGEVVHAQHSPPAPGLSFFSGVNLSFMEREAQSDHTWDLAYDLQKFIQHAFFSEEDSCFNEIDRLLEEIKSRQADKCMARFDFIARLPSSAEIWFN